MISVDWFTVARGFGEFLLLGSAVTGAIVAVAGLRTWRKQLHGAVKFDLARRVLHTVYAVRDEATSLRSPLIMAQEMAPPARPGTPRADADDGPLAGVAIAYNRRWRRVTRAMRDADVTFLEAEVLWGDGIRPSIEALRRLIGDLWAALDEHLTSPKPPRGDQEGLKRYHDVLAVVTRRTNDAFGDRLRVVVAGFETLLSQELKS